METNGEERRLSRLLWILAGLLLAAGLVAYHNSLWAPFYLDDVYAIAENPHLGSFWPAQSLGPRRIVGHLSLALNYRLHGREVFGYHVFNLIVHLFAGWILFDLVRRTLQLPRLRERYRGDAAYLGFAVALLWLVHPLQTSAVTYVIQRLESMTSLFYLACLYAVLRGAQSHRSWRWYIAAIGACWLGMATKEVMITAPVVVLLYDRIFLASSWSEVVRRRGWVYLGFLPAAAWLLWRASGELMPLLDVAASSQASPPAPTSSPANIPSDALPVWGEAAPGMSLPTTWEYLSSQPGVILHYLRLAFWPDHLSLDYMWPIARRAQEIYLPGAVIVGLLAATLAALARWPKVGFLGAAFFLILAPTSSIVPILDLAFEHRMYLPLAAVVTLTVLAVDRGVRIFAPNRQTRALVSGALLSVAVLALLLRTISRNEGYNDPVRFWSESLAAAPHNWRIHQNLGFFFEQQGNYEQAIAHYRQGLALSPENSRLNYNLGVGLERTGNVDEAIARYRKAIALEPGLARAHNNLALLLTAQGRTEEALVHFRRAVELAPLRPNFQVNLGDLFVKRGELIQAAACFRQAIRLNPELRVIRLKLATCQYRLGQSGSATTTLREVLNRDPPLYEGVLLLSWILSTAEDASVRNGDEALRRLEELRQLSLTLGGSPLVLDVLAAAQAEAEQFDAAVQTARRATRLAQNEKGLELAAAIETRLRRYEVHQPYREVGARRQDLGFLAPGLETVGAAP